MNSVRFLLDGNRINETQTPQQLDMEDGDVVIALVRALPLFLRGPLPPGTKFATLFPDNTVHHDALT